MGLAKRFRPGEEMLNWSRFPISRPVRSRMGRDQASRGRSQTDHLGQITALDEFTHTAMSQLDHIPEYVPRLVS